MVQVVFHSFVVHVVKSNIRNGFMQQLQPLCILFYADALDILGNKFRVLHRPMRNFIAEKPFAD